MHRYYTYILRFLDGSYYTGMTNNIARRLREHETSLNPGSYVSRKGPFDVVRVESYKYVLDAIYREKQLQSWSRAKKDALIEVNEVSLKKLAKKQFAGRRQERG